MEKDRQQIGNYFRGIDTKLTSEETLLLRQQLQTAQEQLEKITKMLSSGRQVVEIVERKR